jgi:hypothetical protein
VLRATRKTLTPVRLRAVLPRPVLGVSLRPQAKSLQEPTACVDLVRAYWELSPKARRRADGCRDLYRTPRSRTGIMGSVQCAAQRIGECDASLPPELGLAHGDMLTPREGATGPACRAARPSPTILSDLIRRGSSDGDPAWRTDDDEAPQRKRRRNVVPVLGPAGLSLSLASEPPPPSVA